MRVSRIYYIVLTFTSRSIIAFRTEAIETGAGQYKEYVRVAVTTIQTGAGLTAGWWCKAIIGVKSETTQERVDFPSIFIR